MKLKKQANKTPQKSGVKKKGELSQHKDFSCP